MSAALSAKARERLEAKLDRSLPDFITRTIEQGDLRALLADSDSLAAAEQKADSYDLTHTGDWFERAHALGQRNPGRYAGRDIWHVAVEMAEALPIAERERDEARADAAELAGRLTVALGRLERSTAPEPREDGGSDE